MAEVRTQVRHLQQNTNLTYCEIQSYSERTSQSEYEFLIKGYLFVMSDLYWRRRELNASVYALVGPNSLMICDLE